ncbi:hypothetical protein ElyMa_006882200 [Elysia marginata]|uniref:Secreted protein n=1 Tax=Elysia marginata TaxID=1093978 RepID=A0AAV4JBM3_9GAST|nr:hypothetical protein ElyMa_006882200 [Elysia marginata]
MYKLQGFCSAREVFEGVTRMEKFSILSLTFVVAAVVASPGRERRFLLEADAPPVGGRPGHVTGGFSWDFGSGLVSRACQCTSSIKVRLLPYGSINSTDRPL